MGVFTDKTEINKKGNRSVSATAISKFKERDHSRGFSGLVARIMRSWNDDLVRASAAERRAGDERGGKPESGGVSF